MLNQSTFNCTVLTPMFLAGIDQNSPELRAPSIKAMMRFWWRAAQRPQEATELRENEAKIFGGSGDQEGRSRFRITTWPNKLQTERAPLIPPKASPKPNCIRPGESFSVNLAARDTKDLEIASSSLEITAMLGGLGRRSRRGMGCFYIENHSEVDLEEKVVELLNRLAVSDNCQYKKDQRKIGSATEDIVQGPSFSTNQYPQIKYVVVKQCNKNIQNILQSIGNVAHAYPGDHCGYAHGQNRLASPVYCSLYSHNNTKYVIITLLSSKKDKTYQEKFIREVLKNV